MTRDLGMVAYPGADFDGVAYQDHAWDAIGYHLYDVLGVEDDGSDLSVTYLYCQDDALDWAYTESMSLDMTGESASGSCSGEAATVAAAVDLPALTAVPSHVEDWIEILGDDVSYAGGAGTVRVDGVERAVYPFNTVDCTSCPGGPWIELHSLLVGEDEACFGIFYVYPSEPSRVDLYYTLCLPSLDRPEGSFDATWSGLPPPPPPPSSTGPRGVPPRAAIF